MTCVRVVWSLIRHSLEGGVDASSTFTFIDSIWFWLAYSRQLYATLHPVRMLTVKTVALLALAAQSACGALFPRHGPVKDLSAKDFKKELGDGVCTCISCVVGHQSMLTRVFLASI